MCRVCWAYDDDDNDDDDGNDNECDALNANERTNEITLGFMVIRFVYGMRRFKWLCAFMCRRSCTFGYSVPQMYTLHTHTHGIHLHSHRSDRAVSSE